MYVFQWKLSNLVSPCMAEVRVSSYTICVHLFMDKMRKKQIIQVQVSMDEELSEMELRTQKYTS